MNDAYQDFLRGKIKMAPALGFEVEEHELSPLLKPHQMAIVRWAVQGGRRAIFAAFGLGKSFIQLEIARLVIERAGGRFLIIAPLGVRQEFRRDAEKLGLSIKFVRSIEECEETGLYITNYETVRDGKLDPNLFVGASLDEASVLRSYGSKTYQTFLTLFERVRFRFVATATPSPNRYKELIHYAGFLGIMDTGQALTRFFQRDSTKANNLTLYPHKEHEFWLWLNSWAIFLQRPSDLGFSDEGYDLPPLKVIEHEVATIVTGYKFERDGQGQLLDDAGGNLSKAAKTKRDSLSVRVEKMAEIVGASPSDHFILWHDLEDERRAIDKAVPGVVSVYGTQDLEAREQAICDFSDGKFQHLSAKPVIAGSGCNFQRFCHKAIFLGIGFKFNDFIQAVHRIQRFLQDRPVEIHIIYADTERHILRELMAKWTRHNEMVAKMTEIIKEYGLNNLSMADTLARSIGVSRLEVSGEGWTVANNDTVEEARRLPDNSLDLLVTSIPFANHYEYTPSYNDFGHTDDNDHFWAQMDYLTPELLRAMKPGRVACIHVKDRILFGNVTGEGVPTVSPFHAETIFHYRKHGFQYLGLITINTDVVRENNQTYRLGYTEMCKDATKMGVGSPEYIVLMRKRQSDRSRGYADHPVTKLKKKPVHAQGGFTDEDTGEFVAPTPAGWENEDGYSLARWQINAHAFWRSSGERLATPDELALLGPDKLAKVFTEWTKHGVYDYEAHVKIGEALEQRGALPSTFMALAPAANDPNTWHDVNRMLTLNGSQAAAGREAHVCPLQFDIVDRCIRQYSQPGDLVYDPFGGLATVPVRALKLGRRGRSVELNSAYFMDGVKYCQATERQIATPSIFDILDAEIVREAAE